MNCWIPLGVAALILAQTTDNPARTGAAFLLLPRPGLPVSFDQIEERSRRHSGLSTHEGIVKSKVFRDTSGRIRIEASTYTLIIDAVAGSRVLLLSREQTAYRTPWPKSSEGKLAILGDLDGEASSRKMTATTESIGTRTVEGIDFEGSRITRVAEGEPQFTTTIEEWYSDELKMIGFAVASSPHRTYAVRIENLSREEPNTSLFTIPSEYKTVELPFPDRQ
jgi:hypothetical protein